MEQMKKLQPEIKKIKDEEGIEYLVAFEVPMNGKNIVITTNRQIFERLENGKFKKCDKRDKELEKLVKILEPPKSLDIV